MPAPANSDEFLEFVRKSGVAEENRLKGSLSRIAEQLGQVPRDPSEVAKLLMRDGVLTFFQADQLLQGKWKRFFIGKYKVLERLGSGGMGQVFLCEHKLMRRRVALKVLPAAKADDPSALERFYREARAVAALDHPNIVRAYDIDQDEKLHFLVMEYVDGTNLQDLVKKSGVLDILRACHYVYAVSVGLQHAHEMGLVHRDIKPGNILIDRTGVVKILDMGLARFFHDEDDMLTKKYDENILGTADYLAPEQAVDSHTVDIRADIYSLGATFYYLLTGQPPYPEGTVAQKLLWHQTRVPAPVRNLRPDIPPEIVDVITKMMAKDTKLRYQTPAEVMAALAAWVQTPIPPPTDKEMPTLSPALMTTTSGPLTAKLPAGAPNGVSPTGPKTSIPTAQSAAPLVTPPPGYFPVPSTPDPVPRTIPTPTPEPPLPIQANPVANNEAGALWQAIAEEPATAPVRPAAVSATPPPAADSPNKPRKTWILLLLAGFAALSCCLLLGTGATWFFVFRTPTISTFAAQKTWYVSANRSASPDPARTLTTLRGALDQATADELILILDARIEEPPFAMTDGPSKKKKGVRIEAAPGVKTVVWAPKQALQAGATTVLQLTDVENLRVAGLTLELNNLIDTGISIRGGCSGVTLEDIVVRNSRVSGIRLQNVYAESGKPIRVQNCKVVSDTKIESGVMILNAARNVQIVNNRFSTPGGSALRIDGYIIDTEFKNNRIAESDYGVYLTGKHSLESAYGLLVSQNIFYKVTAAGLFSDLTLKQPKQQVQLTQNYFAETKSICAAAAATDAVKFTANGRDSKTAEGQPDGQSAVVEATFSGTSIADDTTFLVPNRPITHPTGQTIGPNGS